MKQVVQSQTTSCTCQKISKRATLRKDEAVVNGKEQRVYLAHHKAGLIEEDFQLPCLVEDPAVARYGTELRSRYIGNEGGDIDGSDEAVTERDGGPVLPGAEPCRGYAPESIFKSRRNRHRTGKEISRNRSGTEREAAVCVCR
jgi:hypothetical protein